MFSTKRKLQVPYSYNSGPGWRFCCVQGHSLPQQYCKLMRPLIPILKIYLPIKTDLDFFFWGGASDISQIMYCVAFSIRLGGKSKHRITVYMSIQCSVYTTKYTLCAMS